MKRQQLWRKLILVLKIILFPISLPYYLIRRLIAKSKFSIRLNLCLVNLRITARTLAITGLFVIIIFSAIKVFNICRVYSLIVQQIEAVEYEFDESNNIIKNIGNIELISAYEYKYGYENKYFVVFYDKDKKFLTSSSSFNSDNPSAAQDEPTRGETMLTHRNIIGFDVIKDRYFVILDKKLHISGEAFYMNLYLDVTEEIKDIGNLTAVIFIINMGGIIFAFILSLISGRKVFLPIEEMAEAARSISENNMNVRLNVSDSKNELKVLAKTFNEMMDRIEDGYNRQKQFVSDVSHELRTPIAVIQGYIDMLDRWGKNDREVLQESIDAIKNETDNMKNLVENLLFIARSDNGTLSLQKERFNLTAMLKETIKETEIIDKKHIIHCRIEEEVIIYADRNRIKQAVRIFLDNAIKYTPEGGVITVSLFVEKKHAVIEIADTGIGMTENELKHIFDRFYRSDKSRKRDRGGHGLGLTIAKIIILNHGGKINVRSKPSAGTIIKVFLPR